tara:strand:- start:1818 stop:2435 length:618 start_codon:yes stop_codon:yes gene_type:complete
VLVDRGDSIGSIASLANEKLIERLEVHDQNKIRTKPDTSKEAVRVVVIGEVLSLQLEHFDVAASNFSFTELYRNETEFMANNKDDAIDILIFECPAIQGDHIKHISGLFKNSSAKQLIIIYGFTNSAAKKLLSKTYFTYIQAPITIEYLKTQISSLISEKLISDDIQSFFDLDSKAPLRTYSNNKLNCFLLQRRFSVNAHNIFQA